MISRHMLQIKRLLSTNWKSSLEVITKFSQDIGMEFGADKCAYINIERDKRKMIGEIIEINGLRLEELEEEDSYKYLGLDEDIAYKGNLKKD